MYIYQVNTVLREYLKTCRNINDVMGSIQDRLRKKRIASFIGREKQINFFLSNHTIGADSEEFYNIINIYGQGGVGKTTLLRKYQGLARSMDTIVTNVDEGISSTVDFMFEISKQGKSQGLSFTKFQEKHKKLQQELKKLEEDPNAPKGWLAFLTRMAIKGGLHVTEEFIPGSKLLLEHVDKEGIANHGGELAEYLRKRLTNQDEIELVLNPEMVLTPLFIEGLKSSKEKKDHYIFIDTFEATSAYLENWLRKFIEGHFGEWPENIALIIAGRNELSPNKWSDFNSILYKFPIPPFSNEEAHKFLQLKNITNPATVEAIMAMSHNLPVLLATLAEAAPYSSGAVIDPSDTAMERFLRWIKDTEKQKFVLRAAVPRELHQDIIECILTTQEDATSFFDWLCERPFVQKRKSHWGYHPVVRKLMVRHLYQTSYKEWADCHGKLLVFYESILQDLENEDHDENWQKENWRRAALERTYHKLCCSLDKGIKDAIQEYAKIARLFGFKVTIPLVETIAEIGDVTNQKFWGELLRKGTAALISENWDQACPMISKINYSNYIEDEEDKALFFSIEGFLRSEIKEFERAIESYLQVISINSRDESAWFKLVNLCDKITSKEKVAEYCVKMTDIDPNNFQAWFKLGITNHDLGNWEKALQSYGKSVDLNPNLSQAWVNQGLIHEVLENYREAIVCYEKACDLNGELHQAWFNMGNAFLQLKEFEKGVRCYIKAIEIKYDFYQGWFNLGKAYQRLENSKEAIKCFRKALKYNSNLIQGWETLALIYKRLNLDKEHIDCWFEVQKLNPNYEPANSEIGQFYLKSAKFLEARKFLLKANDLSNRTASYYPMLIGHSYLLTMNIDLAVHWYSVGMTMEAEKKLFLKNMKRTFTEFKLDRQETMMREFQSLLSKFERNIF